MQKNQYTTPTLHLVKPQPGSQNFGSAMNENLNKIDEGFNKIIESYNSVVKKIEGSSGYVAADQDYYLYTYVEEEVDNGSATGQLYKIPIDKTPEKLKEWDDETLKSYLVEKLEDISTGAYVLTISSVESIHYTGDVNIDVLGMQIWNDNDVVLIQHIWRNAESRYETIGVKMPHLSGGYYKPDNKQYKLEGGLIKQTYVKQSTVQLHEDIEVLKPYASFKPSYADPINSNITFHEYIYIPSYNPITEQYEYIPQLSGKSSKINFSPVNATTSIKTYTYDSNSQQVTEYGYDLEVNKEDDIEINGIIKGTTSNEVEVELTDDTGNLIFINYTINLTNGAYYLTTNENGDCSLPQGTKIKVIIHRITNASITGVNTISNTQIDGLFPTTTETEA